MNKTIGIMVFLMLFAANAAHAGVKESVLGPVNVLGKAFEDFSTCVVNATGDVALGTVGTMKNLYGAVTGQNLNQQ